MKKIFTLLALLSVISIATPKKSEAGVIIVASGGSVGAVVGGSVLIGLGAIPFIAGIVNVAENGGPASIEAMMGDVGVVIGAVLITLDADGSLSQDQLASALKKNYSEIDNEQAFDALAALVKTKATTVPFVDGKKEVSVTSSELNTIFKSVDLRGREDVFAKMINDLK